MAERETGLYWCQKNGNDHCLHNVKNSKSLSFLDNEEMEEIADCCSWDVNANKLQNEESSIPSCMKGPVQCAEDVHEKENEIFFKVEGERWREGGEQGLQLVEDEDIDLPLNPPPTTTDLHHSIKQRIRCISHSSAALEQVDEQELKVKRRLDDTTEKKLSDHADPYQDDSALDITKFLKMPSPVRFPNHSKVSVYMLHIPQQLPTPVTESSSRKDPSFPMDCEAELNRLRTYLNFPQDCPVYAIKLAADGFVYRPEFRSVDCYFCKARIHLDELNSLGPQFSLLHRERGPDCPMTQGRECGNQPVPQPDHYNWPGKAASMPAQPTQVSVPTKNPASLPALPTHSNTSPASSLSLHDSAAPLPVDLTRFDSLPNDSSSSNAAAAPQNIRTTVAEMQTLITDSVPLTQQPSDQQARGSKASNKGRQSKPEDDQSNQNQSHNARSSNTSSSSENSSSPSTGTRSTRKQSNSAAPAQGSAQNSNNANSKSEAPKEKKKLTYSDLGIIAEKPKRADLAVMTKRMATFKGKWNDKYRQTPKMLAEAGMYYAGYADCARCFFCGGGLKNWEKPDEPWVEHARWFPKCAFIRMCKGPLFVEIVQEKNKNKDDIKLSEVEREIDARLAENGDKSCWGVSAPVRGVGSTATASGPETKISGPGIATTTFNAHTDVRQLEQENEELRTQVTCKICMDQDSSVVFLPCGHLVACTQCAIALKACPLCRADIKGSVKAHMD